METSDQKFEPSTHLAWFMIVVRALGVVLALALTSCNNVKSLFTPLPFDGEDISIILTAAVVIYHIAAGSFICVYKGNGAPMWGVLVADVVLGYILTFFYGPAYLMLSFTMPILMAYCLVGKTTAVLFGSAFNTLVYIVVAAAAFLNRVEHLSDDTTGYFIRLSIAQLICGYLIIWICWVAVQESLERCNSESSLQREKDFLFQEIQNTKIQNDQVVADLEDRENKLRMAGRDNASLKEELDISLKRLQEARVALQDTEKAAEEQGQRASQAARREKLQIQRQLAILQQRLERQIRLVEVSRKLSGSLALSDTLLTLTEQLQTFLPCQSCVIFMLDEVEGQKKLFAEVAASPFTDTFRNYSLQIGEGAPGYAVSRLRPFKIDDGSVNLDGVVVPTVVDKERSALVAPLAVPAQTIGVIYLGRAADHAFTEDELDLLVDFSEMASVSLGNSILYQRAVTQGLRDPLTKCHNSLFLEERMREELKRGNRYMYSVSLLLFSLDGFNQIVNLGQDIADNVLREVVEVIRRITREIDVLSRLEGDTFALLVDHADRVKCAEVGERIRASIAEHAFVMGGQRLRVTISVGAAGSPHDAANAEQLTMRASSAMQQAQQNGGDQVCLWN
ncbi:MAG: diguanylate cyclase [bacterium]|nr:diguanylate cyclase [bacterium]